MRPESKRYFSVLVTLEKYSLITPKEGFSLLRHNVFEID